MSDDDLIDDVDTFSDRFNGSLNIIIDEQDNGIPRDSSYQSLGMTFEDSPTHTLRDGPGSVSFEVVKAITVEQNRDKYVVYTIVVTNKSLLDQNPVSVERRYSDFDKLNKALKTKFSHIMKTVAFPKKLFSGNYRNETIAQRSRAFEQYLSHLFSIDFIRLSKEFCQFFYSCDLEIGYECIHNGQYNKAIPLLQNVANVEKKLLGCRNANVIATLCALVCSYHNLEKDKQAQSVAEAALRCIGKDGQNKHLVALLQLSIRLCWTLGKEKKDLEAHLQELRERGLQTSGGPSLLELVVLRFQKS